MYCRNCGNEISLTAEYCPYCGAAQNSQASGCAYSSQSNAGAESDCFSMALAGLVMSCVSLFYPLGGLLCLAGIILSVISLIKINKLGLKGRGLAIAGIAVGSAVLVLSVIINILNLKMLKNLRNSINFFY